jgi:ribosomal protein S18 acetylase RimI-like enzyme
MENIKIREAGLNDLPILRAFEQEIIKAERPFDSTLKDEETHYYNFEKLLASPKAIILVAEIDNEIAGSGYAEIKKADHFLKHDEYGYVGLMYVKPAWRRKGINQRILQLLKDWIYEQKIKEVRLMVYDENMFAKNAYLKAGFKAHVLEMRLEL